MPRVKALGRLSCRARRSQPGWKREMRTSALVRQKAFPKEMACRSKTAKKSGSGWEWGKA